MNTDPQLIYVAKVALPSSAGYHSGPSGDTEYEADYSKAIHSAVPDGFEVAWATKDTWPKDKDGMTWVKLYCTDEKKAVAYWMDRYSDYRTRLERLQTKLRDCIA